MAEKKKDRISLLETKVQRIEKHLHGKLCPIRIVTDDSQWVTWSEKDMLEGTSPSLESRWKDATQYPSLWEAKRARRKLRKLFPETKFIFSGAEMFD